MPIVEPRRRGGRGLRGIEQLQRLAGTTDSGAGNFVGVGKAGPSASSQRGSNVDTGRARPTFAG
jgi:hypothetical protein